MIDNIVWEFNNPYMQAKRHKVIGVIDSFYYYFFNLIF